MHGAALLCRENPVPTVFRAHRRCLRDWDGTPGLVGVLEAVSHSAEWEGDALERVLDEIRSALL